MPNISVANFSQIRMKLILIIATSSIILILYSVIRRERRETDDSGTTVKKTHFSDEIISYVGVTCREIISQTLDSLANANAIDACTNHRIGSDSLCALGRKVRRIYGFSPDKESKYIYLNYMIESAEKIAETARHMVIRPSFRISISDKCEIQELRNMIADMPEADSDQHLIAANKDFIEHLIAVHTKTMRYEDFNDDSQAYSYLILLYYLHSFINSYSRIISTSSKSPRL